MNRPVPHYERNLPFRLATDGAGAHSNEADRLIRSLIALAATGQGDAQYRLGLAYFRGDGVDKNLATARRLQRAAAEQGVVDAQFELSLLLAQGLGGKVDTLAARRWEDKAAEAGHPRACLNRAARLAGGKRPDLVEVARWYARAAQAGSAEAAARLCKMHLAGQGVKRNEKTARRWFVRAAELGYDWHGETGSGG